MSATNTGPTPSCSDCGTTGGYIGVDRVTPNRISGKSFGLEGSLCHHCYAKHYSRRKNAGKTTRPRGPKKTTFHADPLKYQGLVRAVAIKLRGRGADLDDLIGWGQVGLINACLGYRRSLGVKFSTYATTCVYRTILREIADKVPLIRVPEHLVKHMWKGRTVLPSAERTECLRDAYEVRKRHHVSDHGLDAPLAVLVHAREDRTAERNEAAERAMAILQALPSDEARVLRLRFGIGHDEHTQKQVGAVIGASRETARKIENQAISRLRRQLGVSA